MKKIIAFWIALIVVGGCAKNSNKDNNKIIDVAMENIVGEWADNKYLHDIKALKAKRLIKCNVALHVFETAGKYYINAYYDGFNGLHQYEIDRIDHGAKNNEFIILVHKTNDDSPKYIKFKVDTDSNRDLITDKEGALSSITGNFLALLNNEGKEFTLHAVSSSIQEYVNQNIIAGIYYDNVGGTYIFKSNGEAIFPNDKFIYRIKYEKYTNENNYLLERCEFINKLEEHIVPDWENEYTGGHGVWENYNVVASYRIKIESEKLILYNEETYGPRKSSGQTYILSKKQ
jgi:hypothetical protein